MRTPTAIVAAVALLANVPVHAQGAPQTVRLA
jgi:hypothetical protein